MENSKQRMDTLDYLKGMSMMMIWHAHTAMYWTGLPPFYGRQWLFCDFFGSAGFIFLSVLGTIASCERRWSNGDKTLITRKMFIRASYLLIIGECMNLFNLWYLGLYHLTAWNVLTTIGLFQLLTPLFMKTPKVVRLIMIAAIMIVYFPLLYWCAGGIQEAGILFYKMKIENFSDPRILIYYLFMHQAMMAPIIPYLMVPLITTLVFEGFSKAFTSQDKKIRKKKLSQIGLIGLILLGISILLGFPLMIGPLNEGLFTLHPIPMFLISDYPQNIIFMMAENFILLWIVGTVQMVKEKSFPAEKYVMNFGRFSLSAFMLSHVCSLVPLYLPIPIYYYIVMGITVTIAVVAFYYWNKKFKMVLSFEWIGGVYTNIITRFLDKRKKEIREEGIKTSE
ncbi:MAG: hypothetical protein ACFFCS_16535 [Candidatus Hodarchaeota archaeon]